MSSRQAVGRSAAGRSPRAPGCAGVRYKTPAEAAAPGSSRPARLVVCFLVEGDDGAGGPEGDEERLGDEEADRNPCSVTVVFVQEQKPEPSEQRPPTVNPGRNEQRDPQEDDSAPDDSALSNIQLQLLALLPRAYVLRGSPSFLSLWQLYLIVFAIRRPT